MKKIVFILALCFAIPCFAQNFDLAIGAGHTWDGSGNAIVGTDRRELNLQLSGKWIADNGFGLYAGYTQDAVKILDWTADHRFTTVDTEGLKRLKSLDVGGLYMLKAEKLSAWAALGVAGYDSMDDTAMGWFLATGVDIPVYKRLFVEVKAEYRSHCTDFLPMQAAGFETGILLGYRF